MEWKRINTYRQNCVPKMLGISKLLYTCSAESSSCVRVINFVWNSLPPKVKRWTLIQNTKNGGLKMPDMSLMCKSLQILWVKRILDEEDLQWKIIPVHYLEKVGGKLIFLCNYALKKLDLDLPPVYKDVLTTWSDRNKRPPKQAKIFITKYCGTI